MAGNLVQGMDALRINEEDQAGPAPNTPGRNDTRDNEYAKRIVEAWLHSGLDKSDDLKARCLKVTHSLAEVIYTRPILDTSSLKDQDEGLQIFIKVLVKHVFETSRNMRGVRFEEVWDSCKKALAKKFDTPRRQRRAQQAAAEAGPRREIFQEQGPQQQEQGDPLHHVE